MAGEEELDPAECARLMERDWAADSGGRGFIERKQVKDAWFQIADLHTSEVSPSQYAAWLRQTLDDLAALHAGAFGRGTPGTVENGPSWRRHAWPPRPPWTASEGSGPPSALGRRGRRGRCPKIPTVSPRPDLIRPGCMQACACGSGNRTARSSRTPR